MQTIIMVSAESGHFPYWPYSERNQQDAYYLFQRSMYRIFRFKGIAKKDVILFCEKHDPAHETVKSYAKKHGIRFWDRLPEIPDYAVLFTQTKNGLETTKEFLLDDAVDTYEVNYAIRKHPDEEDANTIPITELLTGKKLGIAIAG